MLKDQKQRIKDELETTQSRCKIVSESIQTTVARFGDTLDEVIQINKENEQKVKKHEEMQKRYANLLKENAILKSKRNEEERESEIFFSEGQRDIDNGQRANAAKSRLLKLEIDSWTRNAQQKQSECDDLTDILTAKINEFK